MKNPSLSVGLAASEGKAAEQRNEERCPVTLPLRLIAPYGERIPAVLTNLSASGLAALVDSGFSPSLPPPIGTQFEVEFFLGEVTIRHVPITVVRVVKQSDQRFVLGCTFVNLPIKARLALRAKVAARLAGPQGKRA